MLDLIGYVKQNQPGRIIQNPVGNYPGANPPVNKTSTSTSNVVSSSGKTQAQPTTQPTPTEAPKQNLISSTKFDNQTLSPTSNVPYNPEPSYIAARFVQPVNNNSGSRFVNGIPGGRPINYYDEFISAGNGNPVLGAIRFGKEATVKELGLEKTPAGYLVEQTFEVAGGASKVGFGVGTFVTGGILNPTETTKNVKEALSNLDVAAIPSQIVASAVSEPGSFIGEYLAFGELLKGPSLLIKGANEVRFLGKTEIPISSISPIEVVTGVERFPYLRGTQSDLLKSFYQGESSQYYKVFEKPTVYHATDYPYLPFSRQIEIGPGARFLESSSVGSDVPGMYFSTRGVSLNFLRLGKNAPVEYSLLPSKESLLSAFRSPKILALEASPEVIPNEFLSSVGKAQSFFGKTPKAMEVGEVVNPLGKPGVPYPSVAYTFGVKPEAEVVLQVKNIVSRNESASFWNKLTGFEKYTVSDGVKVAIYDVKPKFVLSEEVGFGKVLSTKVSSSGYESIVSNSESIIKPSNLLSSIYSGVKSYPVSSSSFGSGKVSSSFISSGFSSSVSSNVSGVSNSGFGKSSVSSVSSYVSSSISIGSSTPSNISSIPSGFSSKSSLISGGSGSGSGTTGRGIPPFNIPNYKQEKYKEKSDSKLKKFVKGFLPQIRRKGKFVNVSQTPVSISQAYQQAADSARKNLARSIKVKEAGYIESNNEFKVNLQDFRQKAAKSKIKDYPVFVQRNALSSKSETTEIQQAKHLKQMGLKG